MAKFRAALSLGRAPDWFDHIDVQVFIHFLTVSAPQLEPLVLAPQGVYSINHDLDQLNLGVSQSVLVGNVVGAAYQEKGYKN